MNTTVVEIGAGIEPNLSGRIRRTNDPDIPEQSVNGVINQHSIFITPKIHVLHHAERKRKGTSLCLLLLFNRDKCSVVINLGAQS